MNFLKHIGKIGDRKVAIIFREVPGEEHMCLVVYTEIINAQLHDDLMKVIESKEAQTTDSLSEVLHRSFTTNGQPLLGYLHNQGFLKKIQTEQVWVTPTPTAKVKLSELNSILNEMEKGEEAIRKLQDMEDSKGMQMPADIRRRREEALAERERLKNLNKRDNTAINQPPRTPLQAHGQDALGDDAIAANLESQATRMLAEARGLMAEAERMQAEAATMRGVSVTAPAETTVKPKKERVKKTKQEV